MHNVRDLVVLPKLQEEVSKWDPMSDPIPIHSWLHPWLEVRGNSSFLRISSSLLYIIYSFFAGGRQSVGDRVPDHQAEVGQRPPQVAPGGQERQAHPQAVERRL